MRGENFNIQILIKDLTNTQDDIQTHLPNGMFESDLTNKDVREIYRVIFRCNCCDKWSLKEEESEDKREHCIVCVKDEVTELCED